MKKKKLRSEKNDTIAIIQFGLHFTNRRLGVCLVRSAYASQPISQHFDGLKYKNDTAGPIIKYAI